MRRYPVVRLTGRVWHIPARLARHARERVLKISPDVALERRFPYLLAAAVRPASTRMTSTNHPSDAKGGMAGAVGAGAHPGTPGTPGTTAPGKQTGTTPETGRQHNW